ncbi:enoyl-CoA hydratase/isomerase family protein [Pseudoxanthomonas taiwanensis]|jgi:Enoyl-CoA hydratase/carnithine racemase|uniref:Enoyl-CoA hydratase n=1 Tax=Pseudoxanthomonas taiwanensis TaxID=176598 RepID=A0A921NWJ1_9GAMM|nr:enoyl-CoA hydratase/isomerase family protein [Pseudoxanthomonas taiwanensis]KAF1686561.1 enoyl-CoA hydratase [Pseudoxanthomonas taiwanensis]MBO2468455.1 enoyl-CoA hydratase/isomerase family protein [Xanthomonadaceae bacterium]
MTSSVQTIDHGRIRELRLARPPVNALDPALCRALIAGLDQAVAEDMDAVVVSGASGIFSAGLDVPYLMSLGEDRHALHAAWGAFFGAARALAGLRIPVVAAITGHAPAGGCVLSLCCDYRVMARSPDPARPFTIGMNETQVGLAVPDGAQHLMRRVVGQHRAERLLVSGAMVPDEEALRIGLVDELATMEEVVPRALAWLEPLLRLPRAPMLQTRALARADLVRALDPENLHLDRFVDGWYDPDTQAGLRALLARLGKR